MTPAQRPASTVKRSLEYQAQRWNGPDFFLLDYIPGPEGRGDPGRKLVRNFKAGDVLAAHVAANLVGAALLQRESRLLSGSSHWWLVPAPGHVAGPAGPSLDHLCRELSATIPWVVYRPGLLLRTRQIRQSSNSVSRPSVAEHLQTLRWTGGHIDYPIMMVDDVYTLGRTSKACRLVLAAAGADNVFVACLAVTKK